MSDKPRSPCSECPWRKDVPTGTWPDSKWLNLYETCQNDGMGVMACHKSKDGADLVCAGFAVRLGFQSIGLRILAHMKQFNPALFSDGGHKLYRSFAEILRANGIRLRGRK